MIHQSVDTTNSAKPVSAAEREDGRGEIERFSRQCAPQFDSSAAAAAACQRFYLNGDKVARYNLPYSHLRTFKCLCADI